MPYSYSCFIVMVLLLMNEMNNKYRDFLIFVNIKANIDYSLYLIMAMGFSFIGIILF